METTDLEWTGERLVTSLNNQYGTFEHLHRYALAREFATDKIVLDIACGEGYGSNLLAQVAKRVIGVDISNGAINHASEKYQLPSLEFIAGSTSEIPLESDSVDLVVSFETIEHHDEHEQMFKEINRVLKENGVLILSSPEKNIYKKRDPINPFHIKEITLEELILLARTHFEHVEVLTQRIVIGSLLTIENNNTASLFKEYDGDFNNIVERLSREDFFNEPFFNIIIASHNPIDLSSFPINSIFNSYKAYEFHIAYLERFEKLFYKYSQSTSYKVGKMIVKPLSKIFHLFKK